MLAKEKWSLVYTMGGACSNLSTPVESPARVHEVKALPHNFTDSKVQAVGAVIEPYDADAEKSRSLQVAGRLAS